jgi:GAF domain-containing protein
MKNHENEIIGVLQLINATGPGTGKTVVPFSCRPALAESLASQAAIALTNRLLITQLEAAVRIVHRPHQRGDRREVALHRRPLRARSGADDDARRGRQSAETGPLADFG